MVVDTALNNESNNRGQMLPKPDTGNPGLENGVAATTTGAVAMATTPAGASVVTAAPAIIYIIMLVCLSVCVCVCPPPHENFFTLSGGFLGLLKFFSSSRVDF